MKPDPRKRYRLLRDVDSDWYLVPVKKVGAFWKWNDDILRLATPMPARPAGVIRLSPEDISFRDVKPVK